MAKESAPPEQATIIFSPGAHLINSLRTALRIPTIALFAIMEIRLDPTAKWHKPVDAVHIGINQALTARICFPHHSIAGINRNVVD